MVMRPNILMFFRVGIYLALQSKQLIPSRATIVKIVDALLIPLALVYFLPINNANYGGNVTHTLLRLLVASLFLITAISLSRSHIGKLIARLEPFTYLLFLSHPTIILLFFLGGSLWQTITLALCSIFCICAISHTFGANRLVQITCLRA